MTPATSLILDESVPPLARVVVLDGHRNTVMAISVAHDAARVASIDYDGAWIVRDEAGLAPLATGRMDGRGRGVSLSPNGARIAGLLALRDHSDTRYSYDVFVGDVGDAAAPPVALPGERACGAAWTPDGERLVLTGIVGFRVHHHGGALVRADESPKGWLAARVTADGRSVYFIRRNQLGCLALDTSRALPAPDIAHLAPPPDEISWHADGLALSRTGDHLTIGRRGGGLHVWDLTSSSAVAELRWEGARVFRTRAVFAPDGARLVASFHHVIASRSDGRVTHVLYDLRDHRVVGGVVTQTEGTGFHATACFSADGRRLYVSEGHRVHVCEVG